MRIAMVMAACFTAMACTSVDETATSLDFGAPPQNYQDEVKAYFDHEVYDPSHVRYRFTGEPYRAVAKGGVAGEEVWSGWAVDVRVDTRTEHGDRTGYRPYTVTFEDGEATALSHDFRRFQKAQNQ